MLRSERHGVVVAFAIIYLIWGSTYLAILFAVETLPPFSMTGIRCVAAGTILYWWGRRRGRGPRPALVHWVAALVVGALLFVGGQGALAWAELRVPSGVAALFLATGPLWMTAMQGLSGDGVGGLRSVVGLALGTIGLVVLAGPWRMLGAAPFDGWGSLALLAGSLSWAVGSAGARSVPRPPQPVLSAALFLLGGGVANLATGLALAEWRGFDWAEVSGRSLAGLAYLVVAGSVVAFAAYQWLLQRRSLAAISTHAYVNPLVAVVLGWWVVGEPISGRILGALALVLPAIGLILSGAGAGARRSKPGRSASPPAGGPSLTARRLSRYSTG